MLDFTDLEIVDAHLHLPKETTLSATLERWSIIYTDTILSPNLTESEKLSLRSTIRRQTESLPNYRGLVRYLASAYRCNPVLEEIDRVISEKTKSMGDYIMEVMDRENISFAVLDQSTRIEQPIPDIGYFPKSRCKWTYPIVHLLNPDWSRSKKASSLDQTLDLIDDELMKCKRNGFCALKNAMAYYRPLNIQPVSLEEARDAFVDINQHRPLTKKMRFPGNVAYYDNPGHTRSLRSYEDFLLNHIFKKAGVLDLPVLIHCSSATNPILRPQNIDPLNLYTVFSDPEITRSGTRFVLLHSGFPYYKEVSVLITQFPHVYVDLSFFSQFPAILYELLTTFLRLAPPEKIMHGSDSADLLEMTGFGAHNSRNVLRLVLQNFMTSFGWSDDDCFGIARMILSENSKQIFANN